MLKDTKSTKELPTMAVNTFFKTKYSERNFTQAAFFFSSSVSLDDISAVRMGRQSEGLRKYTEEQVEGRCFSIMFKGRRKNLDLIASSEEEAKQWVNSLERIISNISDLSCQQKTEQYPCHDGMCGPVSGSAASRIHGSHFIISGQTTSASARAHGV